MKAPNKTRSKKSNSTRKSSEYQGGSLGFPGFLVRRFGIEALQKLPRFERLAHWHD